MDESHYTQFLASQTAGLKEEARTAIRRFVASFNGLEEKEDWTRKFLSTLKPGAVVRHELYEEVIFPVLVAGYENRNPWSLYWLAQTSQNLFKAKHLYQRIGAPSPLELLKEAYGLAPSSEEISSGLLRSLLPHQRTGAPPPLELLKEAYELAPSSEEIRSGLLRSLLRGFEYMAHEWPAGILYSADKPWQTQYWGVLADIRLARELDTSGAHSHEIAEFEQKVTADAKRTKH
jgi:hypothetical protein